MVTRNTLVVRERFHLVFRHICHTIEIGVVHARSSSIRRRSLVERLARRLFTEWFDRLHDHRRLRQRTEQRWQALTHAIDQACRLGKVSGLTLGRLRIVELRILAHELKESLQISFEAHLLHDGAHLVVNTRHFGETQLMDLLGAHRGGRVTREQEIVIASAVSQAPSAIVSSGALTRRGRVIDQLSVSRTHRLE